MTRVNTVPVTELCNQHLQAEHREITRIPNNINAGKAKINGVYPKQFTLGEGHMRFFYPKLKWLHERYNQVHQECLARGINVKYIWPDTVPTKLYNDWVVTEEALHLSRERILVMMPPKPRFTKVKEAHHAIT